MGTTLIEMPTATEWGLANKPAEDLIYKGGMWDQIMFVREVLGRQLAQRADHTFEEYESLVRVCGDHLSKSVKLPVFSIEWKRGALFTLRDNFHDWGVSVEASKPLAWDFARLFDPTKVDSYCEGFPGDRLHEPFNKNPARFTCGLRSKFDVYTFFFLLCRQFPAPTESK